MLSTKRKKGKIDKLCHCQKDFLEGIQQHLCHDIVQIDYSPNPGEVPTLRQMVMELKHSESGNPIFPQWTWTGDRKDVSFNTLKVTWRK